MKPEEIKEFRKRILNLKFSELKDKSVIGFLWDLRETLEELFNISKVLEKNKDLKFK